MIISAIAILALISGRQEPHLLERSKFLMDVGKWREGVTTVGDYYWWSPTEILAETEPTSSIIDITTLARRPSGLSSKCYGWNLSPNNAWIIDSDWDGTKLTYTIFSSDEKQRVGSWQLHTKGFGRTRSSDYGYSSPDVDWSQDSKRLYQIDYWSEKSTIQAQIVERSFPELTVSKTYPVIAIPYHTVIGIHDGKALLRPYQLREAKEFWMKEWDLGGNPDSAKKWVVYAPKDHRIIQFIPSPDSRHTLWLMSTPGPKPMTEDGYPHQAISFWVSGLHGEDMKEIGELLFSKAGNRERMDDYQHFGEYHWNPDGKHVSYIFKRKLYMVQVLP